eukprot:GEMP01067102.1.p1 GENE.GEMP01067102.1~~GEMP01067102.1.p1  ORF type:complete len:169 (+),score=30.81 GEMP01067102.1:113-619(+)
MASSPDNDFLRQPPYGPGPSNFVPKHRASCYCKTVIYEVDTDPLDVKVCHCVACQKLHGAPMQWVAIWHKHNVRFVQGVEHLYFYHSENDYVGHEPPCKVSCSRCRSPIADEGRRMWLGFLPTFDFSRGSIPDSFRVKKHINYGAHVIDVDDSAPTFPGMPPSCHVGS